MKIRAYLIILIIFPVSFSLAGKKTIVHNHYHGQASSGWKFLYWAGICTAGYAFYDYWYGDSKKITALTKLVSKGFDQTRELINNASEKLQELISQEHTTTRTHISQENSKVLDKLDKIHNRIDDLEKRLASR